MQTMCDCASEEAYKAFRSISMACSGGNDKLIDMTDKESEIRSNKFKILEDPNKNMIVGGN